MLTLSYFPGQQASIFLETTDGYGSRINIISIPTVDRIISPALVATSGYPQNMTQFDVGLYYYTFTLPTGAVSVGNYLVDVSFINPINGYTNNQTYQIIVTAPYGNFGITSS